MLVTYLVSGKNNPKALFFVFLCIFLVSALRAPSVGRDLPGYIREYELTKTVPFWNFRYVYFEKGFILFMKICAWIGLSNQTFIVVTSFIIIAPVYYFIKKYSSNYILSSLIYVCYQFFEFDLTAIRQAMAMSICLLAFVIAIEKNKWWIPKFIAVVTIATFIHKGSFAVFFILPFVIAGGIMKTTMYIFVASLVLLLGRGYFLAYIKDFFQKGHMDVTADLYIGANFLFQLFWGVAFVILVTRYEANSLENTYQIADIKNCFIEMEKNIIVMGKIFLLTFPLSLLFGMDSTARSTMYVSQVIMILLPEVSNLITENSKRIFNAGCIIFFVLFFLTNTLISNNFDIVPYVFSFSL